MREVTMGARSRRHYALDITAALKAVKGYNTGSGYAASEGKLHQSFPSLTVSLSCAAIVANVPLLNREWKTRVPGRAQKLIIASVRRNATTLAASLCALQDSDI
jgi:hypothetical protein